MRVQKMARRKLERILLVMGAAILASGSVACSISTESIMEMQDGSELIVTIDPLPETILALEGGVVMNIDVTIGLFDLLFGNIGGDVAIGDLLFASDPFDIFGLSTEELCVVKDGEGGGTFDANIYGGTATFDVALNTIALVGNPALSGLLTEGGLPFPFDLMATIPMSLGDMLGMLTGGGGGPPITQTVDLDVVIPTLIGDLTGHVGGELTLAGTDVFPTSPNLEACIAFLAE